MTAIEIKSQLHQLHVERALATAEGVTSSAYVTDLDEEIAATRAAYIGAAVTEIATLRAELFGAQVG